jgi:hypothetical protein
MASIELWENPAISDQYISNITPLFKKWKHSTRDVGGNWAADGELNAPPMVLRRFFLENLGRIIRVSNGGIHWWNGQIIRMEYTTKGQTFTRSMEDMANYTKVLYSRIGDNLLPDGDAETESGWVSVGTPTTHETVTTWYASGSQAIHVVAAATGDGTQAHTAADTINLAASTSYDCSVVAFVESGTWTLAVSSSTADVITSRATTGAGRNTLTCTVPNTNEHISASVRMTAAAAAEEAYFDHAMLYTSPYQAESQWYTDDDSACAYGRIEGVYLEREMSDDEATGIAQKELSENAWPRTKPTRRGRLVDLDKMRPEKLVITCAGMVWTLRWKHSTTQGTDTPTNHLTSLLDESEFITSSSAILKTNTAEVYLDTTNPITIWDQVEKCVDVGDGAGGPWEGGCYLKEVFWHRARITGTQYEFRNGQMYTFGGGTLIPIELQPGWCYMADMPVVPGPAGGATGDDPRRVWLAETWYVLKDGVESVDWSVEDER